MLRYNRDTKQCVNSSLTYPFRPLDVPPTARYLDTLVIGTNAVEKYGVTVNVWGDNGENGKESEKLQQPSLLTLHCYFCRSGHHGICG